MHFPRSARVEWRGARLSRRSRPGQGKQEHRTARPRELKRFTSLDIDLSDVAEAPKLVLLIGANGSGKSSVFDALALLSNGYAGDGRGRPFRQRPQYYWKQPRQEMAIRCTLGGGVTLTSGVSASGEEFDRREPQSHRLGSGAFYGRSAFRTVPQLTAGARPRIWIERDSDRPAQFIDFHRRFENDIDQFVSRILDEVFGESPLDRDRLLRDFLDPINDALGRVFLGPESNRLHLAKISPSREGKPPEILFRKGKSELHYDLLSSGENEVFNLLLNLFVRRESLQNTVYFLDELDVHLHTELQRAPLQDIVEDWIPADCQLCTASHSLGFIDFARSSDQAVIIDFNEPDLAGYAR